MLAAGKRVPFRTEPIDKLHSCVKPEYSSAKSTAFTEEVLMTRRSFLLRLTTVLTGGMAAVSLAGCVAPPPPPPGHRKPRKKPHPHGHRPPPPPPHRYW